MRNKRLIILLSVLGGIVAIVIIMSAVFTVYDTEAECTTLYGENGDMYQTILTVNRQVSDVADEFRFQNIFLLDEQKVIDEVNAKVANAEAHDVESIFPNKIIVKYRLVTEDLQFRIGDKYAVTGVGGKILSVSDYDRTDSGNGHYSDTIVRVTPVNQPDGSAVGRHIYSSSDCDDMRAIASVFDLSAALVNVQGSRVFDRAAYQHVDFSELHTRGRVTVRMRRGVTFRLLTNDIEKLPEMVRTMVSWYVGSDTPDANLIRGVATISDGNPDKVTYNRFISA